MERVAYRPAEAAAALGVSRDMVNRLIAQGEIRTAKVGTCRLIAKEELERYLRRAMDATPAPGGPRQIREG